MTARLSALILFLALLLNNAAMVSTPWVDHAGGAVPGSVAHTDDAGGHGDDHSQHANHCCHLQAHFQTISADSGMMAFDGMRSRWIPRSNIQPDSLTDSPPTPPPKA